MRHAHATLLAVLLSTSFALPALAGGTCDFTAYANDPDPAGLNVRSGPGTQFPVIGVLMPEDDSDYAFTPGFPVAEFENGWFRIGDARIGQYGDGPERTVFEGPGWISAKFAGFDIQDWQLYDEASTGATVISDLADWYAAGMVTISAIHDCQDGFINVTLTNEQGDTATGWATNLCGNQATTCN